MWIVAYTEIIERVGDLQSGSSCCVCKAVQVGMGNRIIIVYYSDGGLSIRNYYITTGGDE